MAIIIGFVLIGLGLVVLGVILFWPLKDEITPRQIAVRTSRLVYGLWFTGDFMRTEGLVEKYDSIKRILLMEPESPAFDKNIEITGSSREQTKDEILKITKQAVNKGIAVRWYSRHEGIGLTIYDPINSEEPLSDKAWCVVSVLKPHVPREERPLYARRNDVRGEAYFKGQFAKFTEIWNSENLSRKPSPEEYEHA